MPVKTHRAELGSFLAGLAELGGTTATAEEASIQLLEELEKGARSIVEIQQTIPLGFAEFARLIEFLIDAKLIELKGEPGKQLVQLTATGKTLVTYEAAGQAV